jgi:ABC-type uncharacterized transport system substrate-binding protein
VRVKNCQNVPLDYILPKKIDEVRVPFKIELAHFTRNFPQCQEVTKSLELRSFEELENAFRSIARSRADTFITDSGGFFNTHQKRIVELAAKHRLPEMYPEQEFMLGGGLMTYAISISDYIVALPLKMDKILKGAKPADFPVGQPTKFELVINLKTAKQIALTIPPDVLARADKVIK